MTREEKQKAIDALKISVPVMAVTQEEFNDYIQSLNKIMDWLEQEPTAKNNLGVDKEQLKTMIRGLTKWYVKRDNTEVGEPDTAVGLLYDDVMFGIDRLTPVTPQKPEIVPIAEIKYDEDKLKELVSKCVLTLTLQEPKAGHWIGCKCNKCGYGVQPWNTTNYCPNCGAKMESEVQDED